MRDVGENLKTTLAGIQSPGRALPTLWRFGSGHVKQFVGSPAVPVVSTGLQPAADALAGRVKRFGRLVEGLLIKYREPLLEMQLVQERVADAAIALVTSSCTLARLDAEITREQVTPAGRSAAELYLKLAGRTFDRALAELKDNDDKALLDAATAALNEP